VVVLPLVVVGEGVVPPFITPGGFIVVVPDVTWARPVFGSVETEPGVVVVVGVVATGFEVVTGGVVAGVTDPVLAGWVVPPAVVVAFAAVTAEVPPGALPGMTERTRCGSST